MLNIPKMIANIPTDAIKTNGMNSIISTVENKALSEFIAAAKVALEIYKHINVIISVIAKVVMVNMSPPWRGMVKKKMC